MIERESVEHAFQPVQYASIPELDETGVAVTVYTTIRNCAWKYGKDGAFENCQALAATLGIRPEDMMMLNQTHTDGVRVITREDAGEMVVRPLTIGGFDGMVTDEPGILLCTLEADCVPVYLLDPVKKAAGMVHSGWRGTAKQIAANAVRQMEMHFGSDPAELLAAFGPCICADCYEVGAELRAEFSEKFTPAEIDSFFTNPHGEHGEKYQLDLRKAISIALTGCGILPEHIFDTGRCTKEDPELCSWRRDQPVMKSMLTGIMLK